MRHHLSGWKYFLKTWHTSPLGSSGLWITEARLDGPLSRNVKIKVFSSVGYHLTYSATRSRHDR